MLKAHAMLSSPSLATLSLQEYNSLRHWSWGKVTWVCKPHPQQELTYTAISARPHPPLSATKYIPVESWMFSCACSRPSSSCPQLPWVSRTSSNRYPDSGLGQNGGDYSACFHGEWAHFSFCHRHREGSGYPHEHTSSSVGGGAWWTKKIIW